MVVCLAVVSCSLPCGVQAHSPIKPVLVFVSSRRQTRLTALDLLGFAAGDERPRQFVHCPEEELDQAVATIKVPASSLQCMSAHPDQPESTAGWSRARHKILFPGTSHSWAW